MFLIECTPEARPADFLLVAQNPTTYTCLGFSATGTPYTYDLGHADYDGEGRYKPRDGTLPATEAGLRTEFFTIYRDSVLGDAKIKREADKLSPITVNLGGTNHTFDLDEDAQKNINNTIESFAAVQSKAVANGWPNDGTVPWVLEDNSTLPVTAANLQTVKDEGAARGLDLHMEYNTLRASLEALIP